MWVLRAFPATTSIALMMTLLAATPSVATPIRSMKEAQDKAGACVCQAWSGPKSVDEAFKQHTQPFYIEGDYDGTPLLVLAANDTIYDFSEGSIAVSENGKKRSPLNEQGTPLTYAKWEPDKKDSTIEQYLSNQQCRMNSVWKVTKIVRDPKDPDYRETHFNVKFTLQVDKLVTVIEGIGYCGC